MQTILSLGLAEARRITDAARAKAVAEGWNVVIAVLDAGGHLILLERADGTQLGSVQVAQDKARTALLFKRPSKAIEDVVLGGRANMAQLTGALPIEGGLPLLVDGQVVGAIGISGVQSSQDGEVAAAGAAAL
ncbi:MAG: heme-binding protein [Proteobacteria bacterium]|nr:heme-binding protein [Pseudomonadota bacterium]